MLKRGDRVSHNGREGRVAYDNLHVLIPVAVQFDGEFETSICHNADLLRTTQGAVA